MALHSSGSYISPINERHQSTTLESHRDSENPFSESQAEPRTVPSRVQSADYYAPLSSKVSEEESRAIRNNTRTGRQRERSQLGAPTVDCYRYSMFERQIHYEEQHYRGTDEIRRISTTRERSYENVYWTRHGSTINLNEKMSYEAARPPSAPRRDFPMGEVLNSETRDQFVNPSRRRSYTYDHPCRRQSLIEHGCQEPAGMYRLSGDRNTLPQMQPMNFSDQYRYYQGTPSQFYRPDSEPPTCVVSGCPYRPSRSHSVPMRFSTVAPDPFAVTYIYQPRTGSIDATELRQNVTHNDKLLGQYEEFRPFQSSSSFRGPSIRNSATHEDYPRCDGPSCRARAAAGRPSVTVPASFTAPRRSLDEIHVSCGLLPERLRNSTNNGKRSGDYRAKSASRSAPRETRLSSPAKVPSPRVPTTTKHTPRLSTRKTNDSSKVKPMVSPRLNQGRELQNGDELVRPASICTDTGERKSVPKLSPSMPRKLEPLFQPATTSAFDSREGEMLSPLPSRLTEPEVSETKLSEVRDTGPSHAAITKEHASDAGMTTSSKPIISIQDMAEPHSLMSANPESQRFEMHGIDTETASNGQTKTTSDGSGSIGANRLNEQRANPLERTQLDAKPMTSHSEHENQPSEPIHYPGIAFADTHRTQGVSNPQLTQMYAKCLPKYEVDIPLSQKLNELPDFHTISSEGLKMGPSNCPPSEAEIPATEDMRPAALIADGLFGEDVAQEAPLYRLPNTEQRSSEGVMLKVSTSESLPRGRSADGENTNVAGNSVSRMCEQPQNAQYQMTDVISNTSPGVLEQQSTANPLSEVELMESDASIHSTAEPCQSEVDRVLHSQIEVDKTTMKLVQDKQYDKDVSRTGQVEATGGKQIHSNYPGIPSANSYRTIGSSEPSDIHSPARYHSTMSETHTPTPQQRIPENTQTLRGIDCTPRKNGNINGDALIFKSLPVAEGESHASPSPQLIHAVDAQNFTGVCKPINELTPLTSEPTSQPYTTQISEMIQKRSDSRSTFEPGAPVVEAHTGELAERFAKVSSDDNTALSYNDMLGAPLQDVPAVSVTEHNTDKQQGVIAPCVTEDKTRIGSHQGLTFSSDISPPPFYKPHSVPNSESRDQSDEGTDNLRSAKSPESIIRMSNVGAKDNMDPKIKPNPTSISSISVHEVGVIPEVNRNDTANAASKLTEPQNSMACMTFRPPQAITVQKYCEYSSTGDLTTTESHIRGNVDQAYLLNDLRQTQFLETAASARNPNVIHNKSSAVTSDQITAAVSELSRELAAVVDNKNYNLSDLQRVITSNGSKSLDHIPSAVVPCDSEAKIPSFDRDERILDSPTSVRFTTDDPLFRDDRITSPTAFEPEAPWSEKNLSRVRTVTGTSWSDNVEKVNAPIDRRKISDSSRNSADLRDTSLRSRDEELSGSLRSLRSSRHHSHQRSRAPERSLHVQPRAPSNESNDSNASSCLVPDVDIAKFSRTNLTQPLSKRNSGSPNSHRLTGSIDCMKETINSKLNSLQDAVPQSHEILESLVSSRLSSEQESRDVTGVSWQPLTHESTSFWPLGSLVESRKSQALGTMQQPSIPDGIDRNTSKVTSNFDSKASHLLRSLGNEQNDQSFKLMPTKSREQHQPAAIDADQSEAQLSSTLALSISQFEPMKARQSCSNGSVSMPGSKGLAHSTEPIMISGKLNAAFPCPKTTTTTTTKPTESNTACEPSAPSNDIITNPSRTLLLMHPDSTTALPNSIVSKQDVILSQDHNMDAVRSSHGYSIPQSLTRHDSSTSRVTRNPKRSATDDKSALHVAMIDAIGSISEVQVHSDIASGQMPMPSTDRETGSDYMTALTGGMRTEYYSHIEPTLGLRQPRFDLVPGSNELSDAPHETHSSLVDIGSPVTEILEDLVSSMHDIRSDPVHEKLHGLSAAPDAGVTSHTEVNRTEKCATREPLGQPLGSITDRPFPKKQISRDSHDLDVEINHDVLIIATSSGCICNSPPKPDQCTSDQKSLTKIIPACSVDVDTEIVCGSGSRGAKSETIVLIQQKPRICQTGDLQDRIQSSGIQDINVKHQSPPAGTNTATNVNTGFASPLKKPMNSRSLCIEKSREYTGDPCNLDTKNTEDHVLRNRQLACSERPNGHESCMPYSSQNPLDAIIPVEQATSMEESSNSCHPCTDRAPSLENKEAGFETSEFGCNNNDSVVYAYNTESLSQGQGDFENDHGVYQTFLPQRHFITKAPNRMCSISPWTAHHHHSDSNETETQIDSSSCNGNVPLPTDELAFTQGDFDGTHSVLSIRKRLKRGTSFSRPQNEKCCRNPRVALHEKPHGLHHPRQRFRSTTPIVRLKSFPSEKEHFLRQSLQESNGYQGRVHSQVRMYQHRLRGNHNSGNVGPKCEDFTGDKSLFVADQLKKRAEETGNWTSAFLDKITGYSYNWMEHQLNQCSPNSSDIKPSPSVHTQNSGNLHFDKQAVFVRGENTTGPSESINLFCEMQHPIDHTAAYDPFTHAVNRAPQTIAPRHTHYIPARHGTVKDLVYNSNKITPEAQEILLIIRDTIKMIMKDLSALESQMLDRNFRACEAIAEHLVLLPNMLITLLDHLHYSPVEYDLVNLASGLNTLISEIANDPVTVLFHLIELGYRLNELARLLGEDLVPDDLPRLVHAIQSKLHRMKIGHVARQYIHVPQSCDYLVTPYTKSRQLLRLEEDCGCLVNLIHPEDPRAIYCPPGYRTIEVVYDEDRGRHDLFLRRLNYMINPRKQSIRLVTTVVRQMNGKEFTMKAEDANELLRCQVRPRYRDIRAIIMSAGKYFSGVR